MNEWMDGWMDGCMDGRMDESINQLPIRQSVSQSFNQLINVLYFICAFRCGKILVCVFLAGQLTSATCVLCWWQTVQVSRTSFSYEKLGTRNWSVCH